MDASFIMYLNEYKVYLLAGILFSMPLKAWLIKRRPKLLRKKWVVRTGQIVSALALVLFFIIAETFIVKGNYNPFIYFNF